jgi:sugar phosphate isomerase/epimerase
MHDLDLGAIIAFDFKTWDVGEEINLLRQIGLGRVQVYRNYVQGHGAEGIRRTLAAAGLAIDSLHGYFAHEKFPGPPCDLSARRPAARRASLEILRGEARYACDLGCRDVVLHPVGPGKTQDHPWRPAALAESAAALADIGAELGVRFLLENMPPPMFGRDAAMLRRIVDRVNSPHVGLAYDSGHAHLAGDAVGILRAMGPRLWGVHLHDSGGKEDDHLIPGMGVIPFEDVARSLARVRFRGTFMIEVYRTTAEVRRDLTTVRLAFLHHLRRIAAGEAV